MENYFTGLFDHKMKRVGFMLAGIFGLCEIITTFIPLNHPTFPADKTFAHYMIICGLLLIITSKDRLDDELSNHLRFSIYKITFGFSVISLAAMALFLSLREIQTINTMAILYTLEAVLLLHITLYHLGRKYSPKWLLRKDDVSAEYNKSFRILFIIIGILVFMLIYLLPWMGLIKK